MNYVNNVTQQHRLELLDVPIIRTIERELLLELKGTGAMDGIRVMPEFMSYYRHCGETTEETPATTTTSKGIPSYCQAP